MADGGGLCLLVAPSGAKLWVWRYRFDDAEKNMHFGEYSRVTLKDARKPHFAARKLLDTGNPVAERKAEAETKDGCRSGTASSRKQLREGRSRMGAGGLWASLRGTPKPLRRLETYVSLLMTTSPLTW
jgi:hypothetical protein